MQNLCEHCGTITNALTPWQEWETLGCECQCHQAKQYDRQKPARKKKGQK